MRTKRNAAIKARTCVSSISNTDEKNKDDLNNSSSSLDAEIFDAQAEGNDNIDGETEDVKESASLLDLGIVGQKTKIVESLSKTKKTSGGINYVKLSDFQIYGIGPFSSEGICIPS